MSLSNVDIKVSNLGMLIILLFLVAQKLNEATKGSEARKKNCLRINVQRRKYVCNEKVGCPKFKMEIADSQFNKFLDFSISVRQFQVMEHVRKRLSVM